MMEGKKRNLFYCYTEAVANFLVCHGLTPVLRGTNKNTMAEYWAFERGEALDEGLDAWQKQKWAMKQSEESKHDRSEA